MVADTGKNQGVVTGRNVQAEVAFRTGENANVSVQDGHGDSGEPFSALIRYDSVYLGDLGMRQNREDAKNKW